MTFSFLQTIYLELQVGVCITQFPRSFLYCSPFIKHKIEKYIDFAIASALLFQNVINLDDVL